MRPPDPQPDRITAANGFLLILSPSGNEYKTDGVTCSCPARKMHPTMEVKNCWHARHARRFMRSLVIGLHQCGRTNEEIALCLSLHPITAERVGSIIRQHERREMEAREKRQAEHFAQVAARVGVGVRERQERERVTR